MANDDRARLIDDLRALKIQAAGNATPSMNERLRTYQNVGAFMLRHGRLDAILEALEKYDG